MSERGVYYIKETCIDLPKCYIKTHNVQIKSVLNNTQTCESQHYFKHNFKIIGVFFSIFPPLSWLQLAIATQDTDGTEQSLFPSELEATNGVLFETIQLLNASFNANGRSTVNTTVS